MIICTRLRGWPVSRIREQCGGMMNDNRLNVLSRRRFMSGIAGAGSAAMAGSLIGRSAEGSGFHIRDVRVISQQPQFYHGWPTVARRKNGELWVTWSGGREAHVCPFGQVKAMTSRAGGHTWTWPRVLHDSAIDDRDSGVLETAQGTLITTTFSSLAYETGLAKAEQDGTWPTEKLVRWKAARDRLSSEERLKELGEWLLRSTNGGLSWSERIPSVVNSPHGPIQLKDGRLLYAGKQLWTGEKKIGVAESKDDGLTWQWLAGIPTREGDNAENSYHELHAVEAADGTLIAQIRNHNKINAGETLQSESTDGGRTWNVPHSIGVWGLPSHLLKLRDGWLLMTYGHRRPPFGNQARLSDDNGKTWGEAMILSGDGKGGDLGYPSTVELDDGSLLSVWYESMKEPALAVLRQARWNLL